MHYCLNLNLAQSFSCSHFWLVLFPLAVFLVGHEDTYGEVSALRPVLVLHQDAVLAGVSRVDAGDGETGKLARLKLENVVIVGNHLALVL